ncbi:hypothetical protein CN918_29340 [Priestia megaterium]|nr:hypothetical protein CN918_29340 [Priestia megaterium]
MEKKKWGTHQTHCCAIHGCKYGDKDCPVKLRQIAQDYTCESCDHSGFENVGQIEEQLEVEKAVKAAKEEGQKEVIVNTEVLHRILNRTANM